MSEQDELLYEIEAIFYRHTETLTCGYMGMRCDENQSGDNNYKVIIREILAKAKPIIKKPLKEESEARQELIRRLTTKGNQLKNDLKEAKKQERERIFKEIEDLCYPNTSGKYTEFSSPLTKDWQALKGGKRQ